MVLLHDGGVASWGTYRDAGGLLGFSEAVDVQREPLLLDNLPSVRLVVCGANHSLVTTRPNLSPSPMALTPAPTLALTIALALTRL